MIAGIAQLHVIMGSTSSKESGSHCPVVGKADFDVKECPLKGNSIPPKKVLSMSAAWSTSQMKGVDPSNMMPPPNQLPAPGQDINLSTEREVSTIPRASETEDKWVYPSEQMFYNAMIRKGWKVENDGLTSGVMSAIIKVCVVILRYCSMIFFTNNIESLF